MSCTPYLLADDGLIPNHPTLPLLVYAEALPAGRSDPTVFIEETFQHNGWGGLWRNGIYSFHHYHSTAHEALAIVQGWAVVQLGGPHGITLNAATGTVLVLPAGTGHKRLEASADLLVVGAYPAGQSWDLCRGTMEERTIALANIRQVGLPITDPLLGASGPLMELWSSNDESEGGNGDGDQSARRMYG